MNVAGTTVPLLRFLSLSLSDSHARRDGFELWAPCALSWSGSTVKSSPIKYLYMYKNNSQPNGSLSNVLRRPSVVEGRWVVIHVTEGFPYLEERFDLTCLDIGREESDV